VGEAVVQVGARPGSTRINITREFLLLIEWKETSSIETTGFAAYETVGIVIGVV
jgi:hypothetical protein